MCRRLVAGSPDVNKTAPDGHKTENHSAPRCTVQVQGSLVVELRNGIQLRELARQSASECACVCMCVHARAHACELRNYTARIGNGKKLCGWRINCETNAGRQARRRRRGSLIKNLVCRGEDRTPHPVRASWGAVDRVQSRAYTVTLMKM